MWLGLLVPLVGIATALGTSLIPMSNSAIGPAPVPTSAPNQNPVTIAVVDTGISPIAGLNNAVKWDANGSFVLGEDARDTNGHGTAMASIIRAQAPNARLISLKALDSQGNGTDASIASAIRYAVSAGAKVLNLSFSGAEPLPRTREALMAANQRGVLGVAAAGNGGINITKYGGAYPGSYQLPNLVTVGAADEYGTLLPDSNFGSSVSIAAQGSAVPACSLTGNPIFERGTSAAAALISAEAARLASSDPKKSLSQLRATLTFATAIRQPLNCSRR